MVVYEGPSEINGRPIVAIITGLDGKSTNRKTGPMAQLWILDATTEPHTAVKTGEDESVCGDCPARGKWCYVTTFQGPLSIWRTWKRGGYDAFDAKQLRGKVLRFGAYGDPAAVPLGTIQELAGLVDRYTGYTHQWHRCNPDYQSVCMASCDSAADAERARAAGWRTFRVTDRDDRFGWEAHCPASEESGHKLTCFDCGACDGHRRPTVKSGIVIQVHGSKSKQFTEEMSSG